MLPNLYLNYAFYRPMITIIQTLRLSLSAKFHRIDYYYRFPIIILLLFSTTVHADPDADKYLESELYAKPVEVVNNVWSAIGATQPPTYDNAGHNNNLSFIIGSESVLVVNGGASYRLAQALHDEIRNVTTLPIRYVVNENAQGHAMLGNSYWREQGVILIAHDEAIDEIRSHGQAALERMQNFNKDRAERTTVVVPEQSFKERMRIDLGNTKVELIYFGPAHSPGDISVYVPEKDVIITGDMAFHQRLLPVFSDTDTRAWVKSFDIFADMGIKHIIPGHGIATNMETVTRYTKDYLVYMNSEIDKILEDDGELEDAYLIDQSAYEHLDTFEELAKQNAARIFRKFEEDSF